MSVNHFKYIYIYQDTRKLIYGLVEESQYGQRLRRTLSVRRENFVEPRSFSSARVDFDAKSTENNVPITQRRRDVTNF